MVIIPLRKHGKSSSEASKCNFFGGGHAPSPLPLNERTNNNLLTGTEGETVYNYQVLMRLVVITSNERSFDLFMYLIVKIKF